MWSAERRYDITLRRDHRQGAGVPSRRARVREVTRHGHGGASRPVLPRQLRAGRQAVRGVGVQLPDAAQARRRRDGDHVEQQQLRQGCAGRAGAHFARRCAGRCSTSSATRCTRCCRTSPYPGLATTPRDFVEYPSQVNEHWLLTREVLDHFARHYQTGEPMPQALVDKIEQSEKFNQGYATVEYLARRHRRHGAAHEPGRRRRRRLRSSATRSRASACRSEIALRHRLPAVQPPVLRATRTRPATTATCGRR